MAHALTSLRGEGPWRGRSTRNISDRSGRFQIRAQNCYVSSDGEKLINMPGFRTLVDLTDVNNPTNGFRRTVYDSILPVSGKHNITSSSSPSTDPYIAMDEIRTSPDENLTLSCSAEEHHIHGFEQVRNTLVLFGESGHRKIPIYDSSRVQVTLTGISVTTTGFFEIHLSGDTTGGYTVRDELGAGQHALEHGDTIWIEDLAITEDTLTQAYIDTWVNGRFHRIASRDADSAVLWTSPTGITANQAVHVGTGSVYRTRNNASGLISTPDPLSPWEPSIYDRIDDPPALTTWTIREDLDLDAPASTKCYPAWVANRQRDHGDGFQTYTFGQSGGNRTGALNSQFLHFDGSVLPGRYTEWNGAGANWWATPGDGEGSIAWSRRRQKALPYRLNPEALGDRIVFAAPGYACCFQAPLMVPIEPESWPSPTGGWSTTSGRGIFWPGNDMYDKPRCLGVPKAILLDSYHKTAVSPTGSGDPSPASYPYSFLTSISSDTTSGFVAGVYQIAVSYVDEGTGEEGLASEPVTITLTNDFLADMRLLVLHPGYFMPECLAWRINIYMTVPDGDALGFYTSVPMTGFGGSNLFATAKYGAAAGGSPDATELYVTLTVPAHGSPDVAIDLSRLAPASGQMPRGAEAIRFIRGQLFTIGHSGTHGDLLGGSMSAIYDADNTTFGCTSPNEVQIRGARSELIAQSTPALASLSPATDGPWGIASNYLPPAYQGAEFIAIDLLEAPYQRFIVDFVRNGLAAPNQTSPDVFEQGMRLDLHRDTAFQQRLTTRGDIRDGQQQEGDTHLVGRATYMVMPRGQIQVGDPGRPGAVNSAGIQFLDSKKDDDGIAIGQLGGAAVICSKKETHLLQWGRTPRGTVPTVVSTEHGCIATNSMVTFDGGVAWISDRGPCAMSGSGLEWIGRQLEEDFSGDDARYAIDSKGLMRHCWGAHDQQRGLVYWGLVTSDSTHEVSYKGTSATFANSGNEAKSRFPCDEVLIWSYRANAFTTWRPPAGLEILWMRPLTLSNGRTRMCFLAADKRIYAFDEQWSDTNADPLAVTSATDGSGTSFVTAESFTTDTTTGGGAAGRGAGTLVRAGMTVVQLDTDGEVVAQTTIASATPSTNTLVFDDSMTWKSTDTFEVGLRPAITLETSYIGQASDVLQVNGLHLRYHLLGDGKAHCRVTAKTFNLRSESVTEVGMTDDPDYYPLVAGTAASTAFDKIGQRRIFEQGKPEGSEVNVTLEITGRAGISITDLVAEVNS